MAINLKPEDEKLIERGIAQFERGEGLTPEDSMARLESKKTAWRDEQRRG